MWTKTAKQQSKHKFVHLSKFLYLYILYFSLNPNDETARERIRKALSKKTRCDLSYIFVYYFNANHGHSCNIRFNSTNTLIEVADEFGVYSNKLDDKAWEEFSFKKCSFTALYMYMDGSKEFYRKKD